MPWFGICVAVCVVACIGAVLSVGVVLYYRHRERVMLKRLDGMLNAAINGSFSIASFDESLLSEVEAKFSQYLSASALSAKNVSEEKEEIKQLISDLSHQTKTPITNLLLYTELLAEQELPTEGRSYVEMLRGQAKRLEFFVEAFVKTSRLETGVFRFHKSETEPAVLLETVAGQFEMRAREKGITFCVEGAETSQKIKLDVKWTGEALENLVDNAIKYTPEGGKVTLRAVPYEMFWKIDVEDTGIGIPEEERSKVFGRFYRSAAVAETEGIGIGLYLVRRIIAGQGGYVKFSDGSEGGTVVSVFLPRD
ncbi:MAG: HAMP domain-containing histidine kinase [Lachnospiraceae bacterium]|nr:HAMP domain-containing histidine kinase [Lachnospiraceae bacterium]